MTLITGDYVRKCIVSILFGFVTCVDCVALFFVRSIGFILSFHELSKRAKLVVMLIGSEGRK
jgi:hypothetical protein